MAARALHDAVARADASRRPPVLFIHGLWLRPSSWDRWVEMFEAAGYAALAPGWPAEVGGAAAPETIGEAVTYFTGIVEALSRRPAIVGQSFGGLIAQILAGQGRSTATVAIDPAPFRGGLPPPVAAPLSALPVPQNQVYARRKMSPPPEQARYIFGNAVSKPDSEAANRVYRASASGPPIQVTANPTPRTEARVDTETSQRGPLLVISRENSPTAPQPVAGAVYEQQSHNRHAITELVQLWGRGFRITTDADWHEVAQIALAFVKRFL